AAGRGSRVEPVLAPKPAYCGWHRSPPAPLFRNQGKPPPNPPSLAPHGSSGISPSPGNTRTSADMTDAPGGDDPKGWKPATQAVRGGLMRSQFGEISEAIYLTSGYAYDSAEQAEARMAGREE